MKNSKKGFTLIELLAVIAILAILIVIAVPNVLNLFADSRLRAYTVDAQAVLEAAQTQWSLDSMGPISGDTTYKKIADTDTGLTIATISKNAKYCVIIQQDGRVKRFSYSQNGYMFTKEETLAANDNKPGVTKADIAVTQSSTVASCE